MATKKVPPSVPEAIEMHDDLFTTPAVPEVDNNPLSLLMNEENPDGKTDLTEGLIIAIGRARIMSDVFDCPELRQFCDQLIRLRVSRNRLGRKEVIEGLQAQREALRPDENRGALESLRRLIQ